MQKYSVEIKSRPYGALGIGEKSNIIVTAENRSEVIEKAIDAAIAMKRENIMILNIKEITG